MSDPELNAVETNEYLVIYDKTNGKAWLQAEHPFDLEP
jgi:hypothetical protein